MTTYKIKGDSSKISEWLYDNMPRDKCRFELDFVRTSTGNIKCKLDITIYDPALDTLFLLKWGDQLDKIN
jgi:hypothetical protein